MLRWGVAVAGSVAGFVLAWWVCQELIRLDEGVSLGIAGAVLAVVLTVAGWWAAQGADSAGSDSTGRRLVQKARRAGTSTWRGVTRRSSITGAGMSDR